MVQHPAATRYHGSRFRRRMRVMYVALVTNPPSPRRRPFHPALRHRQRAQRRPHAGESGCSAMSPSLRWDSRPTWAGMVGVGLASHPRAWSRKLTQKPSRRLRQHSSARCLRAGRPPGVPRGGTARRWPIISTRASRRRPPAARTPRRQTRRRPVLLQLHDPSTTLEARAGSARPLCGSRQSSQRGDTRIRAVDEMRRGSDA